MINVPINLLIMKNEKFKEEIIGGAGKEEKFHPAAKKILNRIGDALRKEFKKVPRPSQQKIADQCGVHQADISILKSGKITSQYTLNRAIQIWLGLGYRLETLFIPTEIEDLPLENIDKFYQSLLDLALSYHQKKSA